MKPPEFTSSTTSTVRHRYDRLTDDFLYWIREVPLERDAVNNLPFLLRDYDRQKTLWRRIKCLFV